MNLIFLGAPGAGKGTQAEVVCKELNIPAISTGVNIDKVVEIHVPDEAITARMSGRRVCEGCGNSYHIQYKPTKVEGICDACGAKVVQRVDDKPETVISRLKTYHEKTAPLKDFYAAKGKLVTVEGQDEISETSKLTLAAIKG